MDCENSMCIYNDDDICLLDHISVDSVGLCTECIMVSFDKDLVKQRKAEMLEIYKD